MFEKGRGNDHKELLVIYSSDTIRLGSCYCCNNLGQKSTACCTFFVNILLLSHRLCHIFVWCPSFTVLLRPSPIPSTRSSMESLEMVSQKNWEECSWTGREGKHKIHSLWYWYCVCIHCHEYTEVRPSPQKETMKTLTFKCFHMTCVSMSFFFHFLSFRPIIISPSVELYPCCIFIRPILNSLYREGSGGSHWVCTGDNRI